MTILNEWKQKKILFRFQKALRYFYTQTKKSIAEVYHTKPAKKEIGKNHLELTNQFHQNETQKSAEIKQKMSREKSSTKEYMQQWLLCISDEISNVII